jgi:hypothetical protein
VILDRKGGEFFDFQAFDGLIVEAAVGDFHRSGPLSQSGNLFQPR